MTDAMKKVFPFLAVLALLCSCNRFQVQRYEDDLVMPRADNSKDSLFLSIELEYAAKGLSPEVLEQINGTILTQAFDLEDGPGTVEEAAIRYRENLIDEYLTEADFSWEDHLTGVFTEDYRNWKNYLLTYYSFRGGAHGIQTVSHLVFDKTTGQTLSEADLFADGYNKPVAALMQKAVHDAMEKEDAELLDLVVLDAIGPNGNFAVSDKGVEWAFQPYEVGPYALGIVTASLGWEQLKPYLK